MRLLMYSNEESLSHLEYFKHWPLKYGLCNEYEKGNLKTSLNQGANYNTFF